MKSHRMLISAALAAALVAGCGGDDGGPTFADDHPRIYLPHDRARLEALVAADHPSWGRFKRIVDAVVSGTDVYGFEAWNAALVGQLTGDPSYCETAVARVEAMVAADEAKIDAGERPDVAFDSYLYVGPMIGDLAITYDWCFDATTDSQRRRWIAYANQAVWNVWHPDEANWGGEVMSWSGWSIDNPSNNYYYSFLRATMLLGIATRGETPEGEQWIAKFRDEKIGRQLVPTFNSDLTGGGSREGTGYGVAMKNLFELYDFWHGSTGERIDTLGTHARFSMLHMMHSTAPTLDRIAPIGDHSRDSTAAWFDYHRHYLQTLSYLYADDPIAARATTLMADSSVPQLEQRFMLVYDFLYATTITPAPLSTLGRAYYAPGVGQLYSRSSWAPDATWLTFIAGPYSESHAHQDQGSFLLFKGDWLAWDANVESNGLQQDTDAHNLIRFVDGGTTVRQREGTTSTMSSIDRGPGWLYTVGDLTAAYGTSSPVDRWQRELVMIEPDVVVIYDRVRAPGVEQIWQVTAPNAFAVSGARATATNGRALHVERVLPAGATARDVALSGDFTGGHRLEERSTDTGAHLHVLSIDGAVTGVTAAPTADEHGVNVTLADGRTATVRFGIDAPGGHLTITGGGADVDETLTGGLTALPELE